jgi:alkylation response protein AidB-like acyl-CoA dehydrogenase
MTHTEPVVAISRPDESELKALRETVREFLLAKSGQTELRAAMQSTRGYDQTVWSQAAEQLSLPGLALPTEYGGDGYGLTELAVVLEEMGTALLPSPFLATVVLAAGALLASGDDTAANAYLPSIASGKSTATLAVAEKNGSWDTEQLTTTATYRDGAWRLSGDKWFVVNGATAELILIIAATGAETSLFAIPADADGLSRIPLRTLDETRPLARLTFADTPAVLVAEVGRGTAVVDRVLDFATTGLAAEQVGGARACLAASTDYARERVQFGRPIGTFQAIKHKCADMLVQVELAAAAAAEAYAANAAGWSAQAVPRADGPLTAAIAHAVCSEAFMFTAMENIQVHGGIGFTWEHPAHLYFRRAKSSQLLFGGPAVYYERLLQRAGV